MIKKLKKLHNKRKEVRKARRDYHLLTPTAYDNAVISWIAPEMIRHERGTVWKVIMVLMILSLMVLGIYNDAWTFSLAIGTFAGVYYLVNLEHPKDVEIKLSQIGIKVGSRKYPYNRIKAFWVLYDPPLVKTLNLRVEGEIISDITIELNGQNPSDVREFLMEKIPELSGQSQKLSDLLLRIFKI